MIVEEILSDEDVTPIPPSLPGVHIEEIDEQFVTEGMVYYIYIYIQCIARFSVSKNCI